VASNFAKTFVFAWMITGYIHIGKSYDNLVQYEG